MTLPTNLFNQKTPNNLNGPKTRSNNAWNPEVVKEARIGFYEDDSNEPTRKAFPAVGGMVFNAAHMVSSAVAREVKRVLPDVALGIKSLVIEDILAIGQKPKPVNKPEQNNPQDKPAQIPDTKLRIEALKRWIEEQTTSQRGVGLNQLALVEKMATRYEVTEVVGNIEKTQQLLKKRVSRENLTPHDLVNLKIAIAESNRQQQEANRTTKAPKGKAPVGVNLNTNEAPEGKSALSSLKVA